MKILVIDDSSTMRRVIIRNLADIGYRDVVEAENGEVALARLNEGGFDFIMTDWNMPVMNGLELVQAVKSGPFKDLPILMITTNSAKKDVILALSLGVSNYVVKPFTAAVLKEKMQYILEGMA